MAEIPRELLEFYTKIQISLLPETYVIVRIAKEEIDHLKQALKGVGRNFLSTIFEEDTATLIISKREWGSIAQAFINPEVEEAFRILRLDMGLEHRIVGYLAFINRLLAGMEVNIGIISSFGKDYLIIRREDLSTAVRIIFKFIQDCRERIKKGTDPFPKS